MKTFDEAAEVFKFLHVEVETEEDVPAALDAVMVQAREFSGRRLGLAAEAGRSAIVINMIEGNLGSILHAVCEAKDESAMDDAVRTCLFSMFMNGLVIGIEMEKQEL